MVQVGVVGKEKWASEVIQRRKGYMKNMEQAEMIEERCRWMDSEAVVPDPRRKSADP